MSQFCLELFEPAGARHNGGPALVDHAMTLEAAQQLEDVQLRPSYVQCYAGPGAPKQAIVGRGSAHPVGQAVLLACGHFRIIRDWGILPAMGRKRPQRAACGLCRLRYAPRQCDADEVERLRSEVA